MWCDFFVCEFIKQINFNIILNLFLSWWWSCDSGGGNENIKKKKRETFLVLFLLFFSLGREREIEIEFKKGYYLIKQRKFLQKEKKEENNANLWFLYSLTNTLANFQEHAHTHSHATHNVCKKTFFSGILQIILYIYGVRMLLYAWELDIKCFLPVHMNMN